MNLQHNIIFFCFFYLITGQELSQTCPLDDGRIGICSQLEKCSSVLNNIKMGLKPTLCGFLEKNPIVCCPSTSPLKNSKAIKSDKKCSQYYESKLSKNPLTLENKNLSEIPVDVHSFANSYPHMALLGFGEKNSKEWLCAGTLISDEYVLTAAHCMYSKNLGMVKWVLLGNFNAKNSTDLQEFEIEERIEHPDYNSPILYHDIALLKLKDPVTITPFVKPACLPTANELEYTNLNTFSWKRISSRGNIGRFLQKIDLVYFPPEKCKGVLGSIPKKYIPDGIIEEIQICTGSYESEMDRYQGISGSPLQKANTKYRNAFDIIGVNSFAKPAGGVNTPDIYSKVSYYIDWIESIVFPHNV